MKKTANRNRRNVALLKAIHQKRWKQKDLAEKTGLTETTISNIVNQKTVPSTDSAMAIAGALEVDVESIFVL